MTLEYDPYDPNCEQPGTTDPIVEPIEEALEFHIADENTANWYVGKITMMKKEIDLIQSQAKLRIARLETNIKRLEFRFGAELEDWAYQKFLRDDEKTIRLPLGSVRLTSRKQTVEVENVELVPFKDRFATTVVKYDTTGIKKYALGLVKNDVVTPDGEVIETLSVPGLKLVPPRMDISIIMESGGGRTLVEDGD